MTKLTIAGAVAGAVIAFSSPSANAASLGLDITGGGGTFNTDSASVLMLGWEFNLSEARTVTGLGWWDEGSDGLLEDHRIGIWDSGGTLLATGTADNGDATMASASGLGRWVIDSLGSALTLGAGDYVIGGIMTLSVFDDIRQHTSIATDSALTFTEARFIRDSGFALPSISAGTSERYFGPTLVTSPIPIPASLPLLVFGLAGLGLMRRRKKHS